MPEGQGSGGTFSRYRSTSGRLFFFLTLLTPSWPNAGGHHFCHSPSTYLTLCAQPKPPKLARSSKVALPQPTHWAASAGTGTPPKQLPLQGAGPNYQHACSRHAVGQGIAPPIRAVVMTQPQLEGAHNPHMKYS